MSKPFATGVGAVLSADIAVPEHRREVAFYSRVLCTGDHPLWRENDLTNNLGIPVIGLGERSADYADLPVQWMPHIQVGDVASGVQRALDLGGRELMHHKDDEGRSRWAVLLDPNEAAFGLIPVVPEKAIPSGEGTDDGVGRIGWLDLTVSDTESTRDFYRQVVGWSTEGVEMKDRSERYDDFNMLDENGTPAAGICHARGVNVGLPPVWMIYLPVGDIAESLRRVEEEEGRIIRKTTGKDGSIAYAAIEDPVGAAFALVPAG